MASLKAVKGGSFLLEGDISTSHVPALLESGWQVLSCAQESTLIIDFSMVVDADSATLAMVLEWMKRAQSISKCLMLTNFPEELYALATICGLNHLLVTDTK